jgi:Pentapeptide repeats (8 copies)
MESHDAGRRWDQRRGVRYRKNSDGRWREAMTAMPIRYPAAAVGCAPARGREHLSSTDLHLAGLSATDLPGADLGEADLQEARLRDTCLHAADLRDANLRGADLEGADLDAADLRGAVLDGANLRAATFSPLTAWPAGFDPLAAGATPTRTEHTTDSLGVRRGR